MNQSNGLLSLDALFFLLPVLLLVFYVFSTIFLLVEKSNNFIKDQTLFNKLVSVGDYTTELALAEKTDTSRLPNLVKKLSLSETETNNLKDTFDFKKLSVSEEQTGGVCIYRLVVFHSDDLDLERIEKIYFCGESTTDQ